MIYFVCQNWKVYIHRMFSFTMNKKIHLDLSCDYLMLHILYKELSCWTFTGMWFCGQYSLLIFISMLFSWKTKQIHVCNVCKSKDMKLNKIKNKHPPDSNLIHLSERLYRYKSKGLSSSYDNDLWHLWPLTHSLVIFWEEVFGLPWWKCPVCSWKG